MPALPAPPGRLVRLDQRSASCLCPRYTWIATRLVGATASWCMTYRADPRWGMPIYTSDPSTMAMTRISDAEYNTLVRNLKAALGPCLTAARDVP